MNPRNIVLAFITALLAANASSKSVDYPLESTPEFFQSLTMGRYDLHVNVPHDYQIVQHSLEHKEHTIGFVLDDHNLNNWREHIGVHVSVDTSESASAHIRRIQDYIIKEHPGAEILKSDIARNSNGIQDSHTSLLFNDGTSDVVLAASYYSDNSTLTGVEVSVRVNKSVKRSLRKAEKMARSIISLD
ncbi:hypothetical protein [Candidatus Synchoanobacter obligatus]|uniref:Uncharacterized protein n=1 Tax=Candidatus Synchoanobacter obligatus TaxID=2919597 RepID=A0ABT1L443_9GAMM|nr:hypothetical protein [Candidatus Synchoanobacter obligatus]MCP8351950.1 hypothetical protein [Candidatus Synchoanobacter obligatus]